MMCRARGQDTGPARAVFPSRARRSSWTPAPFLPPGCSA